MEATGEQEEYTRMGHPLVGADLGGSAVRYLSVARSALRYRSASSSEYGGKGSSSSGRLLGDRL
ncbi:hypothetical protein INR49_030339 [Caranx melampygus]|nr:hypothetical protein INR49_030339 [Caranx melampygus]